MKSETKQNLILAGVALLVGGMVYHIAMSQKAHSKTKEVVEATKATVEVK